MNNNQQIQQKQKEFIPHRWIAFYLTSILIFIFFAFFGKSYTSSTLELNLKDKKIIINTSKLRAGPVHTKEFDPDKFYIDSSYGVLFKLPTSGNWSKVQVLSGIDEFFEAKSAVLTPMMRKQIKLALSVHPFGPAFESVETIRLITTEPLHIKITDESSNDLIDEVIKKVQAISVVDSSTAVIANLRRRLIGFEELEFANEFMVSIYDKSKLKGSPIKASLANFAMAVLRGNGLYLDHLVADNNSVLSGGVTGMVVS